MRLSEALRNSIRFDVMDRPDGTGKMYRRFQACVQRSFPQATAQTFPLAFACPLFRGPDGPDSDSESTQIVDRELPEGFKLPCRDGIFFLCDAIDRMAVAGGMSESRVAAIVERIEDAFTAAGLSDEGRPTERR